MAIAQSGGSIIGDLILDATLSEVHRKTNRVTDHPIEDGGVVSDHIQRQPDEIDINGLVSDDPVMWLASLFALSPVTSDVTGASNRAASAYAELRRMMDDGILSTVVTTLREYENMAITSLNVPKDASTGNVLSASISFREIIKVETKEVAAPVTEAPGDAAPTDAGTVTAAPAKKGTPKPGPKATSVGAALFGVGTGT